MGIFPRYDKEGPGVYADDPKRGPIIRFFQTYAGKFFKLVSTNLMFVLFNIPSMIIAYIGVIYFLPLINPIFEPTAFQNYLAGLGISAADASSTTGGAALQLYFLIVLFLVLFVVGMQLVSVGPVQTGLSYVYRNFARESATFVWSDFAMSFKNNWKQSLIATGITLIVTVVIMGNIVFYSSTYTGQYAHIFSTLFVMALVFFMCIQIFVYPLIASLDLKLKNIYKNAILFFMARFLPTIGIFIVDVVVLLVIPVVLLFSFTYAGFALAIVYYAFFAFSFVNYLNTFFVWQQIERYIIKPKETEDESSSEAS
jgi:uncharacterized membrane protein YesL